MEKDEIQIPNKEELIKVMRQNHIVFAAVFGSRAKGTAKPNSDYDFLVEFDPNISTPISRFMGVKEDLEKTVNAQVDLVTVYGINRPSFRKEVLTTMKVLYGNKKF